MNNSYFWKPMNLASFGATAIPLQALNTIHTINISESFNNEFNSIYDKLNQIRGAYQQELNDFLRGGDMYTAETYRNRGVHLAWKYEQADIQMGGHGSEQWNEYERNEILNTGKVRGAEGHHQMNVADHPTEQSNPDNIKFYRTRDDHLNQGHNGDFRNESDAPMIDRNEMLRKTNNSRILRNELVGAGLAAIIGFAVGASVGFVVSMAQNGINPETLRAAGVGGVRGAGLGLASHAITRVVDSMITPTITNVLQGAGVGVAENISRACTMGITGVAIIMIVLIVQYIHLRNNGYSVKNSLRQVGKQAALSLGILAITLIVQVFYGNVPAAIAGIVLGLISLGVGLFKTIHLKRLIKKLNIYSIEHSYPQFK